MSMKPPDYKNSINQTGGTINSTYIVLGDYTRTTIHNAAPILTAQGRDDVLAKLAEVLDAIEAHGAELPDKATTYQLVQKVTTEAARKEPDKLNLRSFLAALADEVKSVSVIATAVTALVTSARVLF